MLNRTLKTLALIVFVSSAASSALAQSSQQAFKVVVPTGLSITAPVAAQIVHDETNDEQQFPAQEWIVKGNASAGLNVTFATQDTFKHTSGNYQRNARLSLGLGATQGPATWQITKATDVTDYAANDQIADVTASSNGVGRANLALTVAFVTEEFGVFAAGDYDMTVVGTVAAN